MSGRQSRQHRLQRREHAGGLRDGLPEPHAQLAIGRRNTELVEEDPRELVVVVLPGVDEQLLVALAQPARYRCGLYELRPITDDRDDSQRLARIEFETYMDS